MARFLPARLGFRPLSSRPAAVAASQPQSRQRPWWQIPISWWWRSLPLRVVASTLAASVLVLLLGGFLLMQQAQRGVLNAKVDRSRSEAAAAVATVQSRLNAGDITSGTNINETLTQLVDDISNRSGGSGQVIVFGQLTEIKAGSMLASSVPQVLRTTVQNSDGLYVTPTYVQYESSTSGSGDLAEPGPGIAIGSAIRSPGYGRYELYLVYPLSQEIQTLKVLQSAVITTGALLVVLLTLIAGLVARQVVTPVRAARQAAERLAEGFLDDRLPVKGQDDLARLAVSMNHMASELQKQITQLEDLSRVQQRFVSDVSHELRTPLTTVRMAAEVLYEGRDEFDPVAARSAELLQHELDRFEALLTDLLEISRFDAGAAVLSLDAVDLREVTHDVVLGCTSLASAAGSEVSVLATGPCVAEVDVRRIERILRNLLVNAIEHGEGRPISVSLACDDSAVAVAVRDHGVGFEAHQSKQVFLRFWRGDPSRARKVGGTGLGLAISMEDARLHGGWLTAWGRPGLGAQFRLTLPRRAGAILESSPLPLVPRDLVVASLPPAGPMARADADGKQPTSKSPAADGAPLPSAVGGGQA